uniref:Proactivator polypeptide n=1 Tax=Schistocephalus solidus TaxID=70667 RepID=A0A0X3PV17_SCHSO
MTRSILFSVIVLYAGFLTVAYSAECNQPDAVFCRSFFSAAQCGKIKQCEDLWLHAHDFGLPASDEKCTKCESYVREGKFMAVADKISSPSLRVSGDYLGSLSLKMLNAKLTCAIFGQCSQSLFTLPNLRFKLSDTCSDCEKIVVDVRALIENNSTKEAVATYLKAALCTRIPLKVVDLCKNAINAYTGIIVDLVSAELDPPVVCALFGLCQPETKLADKQQSENCSESQTFSWIHRPAGRGFAKFHSRLSKLPIINSPIQATPACTDCVNVFSRIRDRATDPKFDEMLKNLVKEKLCSAFGIFENICKATVSKEVDAMINDASKTNITELCVLFEQCEGKLSVGLQDFMQAVVEKQLSQQLSGRILDPSPGAKKSQTYNPEFPVICEFCETLVKKILDLTVNNLTEETVIIALQQVCELFPTEQKLRCRSIIEQYGQLIIEGIISGTAPKIVCMSIGLCNSLATSKVSFAPIFVPSTPLSRFGDTCELCQMVVQYVYNQISDNATEAEIEEHLKHVCNHVGPLKEQCEHLIETYSKTLIKFLVERVPPRQVCQEIYLCPEARQKPKANFGDSCMLCELVTNYLESELTNNKTVDEMKTLVKKLCKFIPSYKLQCEDLVDSWTGDILKWLASGLPPREICVKLGLCPSKKLLTALCAGGPVAWCRDATTAKLCSATTFCNNLLRRPSPQLPSAVRPIACYKLHSLKERCEDRRTASLCGFSSQCYDYYTKDQTISPKNAITASCRFCRQLLVKRITRGSYALDCSLYFDVDRLRRCENIKTLSLPRAANFEQLNAICSNAKLCDGDPPSAIPMKNLPPPQPILGGNPCTWGPSVACQDLETAQRCKSLTYCQRKVWGGPRPLSVSSEGANSASPISPVPSEHFPGLKLVDCQQPLATLCSSPSLHKCAPEVIERCATWATVAAAKVVSRDYVPSEADRGLRGQLCRERSTSMCTNPILVAVCDLTPYCEAMGFDQQAQITTPATTAAPLPSECSRGTSYACQTYENAVKCNSVALCSQEVWMR